MELLIWTAPWVLASVCVGIVVGMYFGLHKRDPAQEGLGHERQAVLQVLADLLGSAERMSSDVENHNTQIQAKARHVGRICTSGEMESVRQALMAQMEGLLVLNMRLQTELLSNRYQMEERASELDEARREARTDALSGVANRKALDEKLHVLLTAWKRNQRPFVLVLMDLDHFKRINDSHGHQAGDTVLVKLGAWLREWARENDIVARYGGDEFAMLLPDTEFDEGLRLARMVRERTAERASDISLGGNEVSVSLSIGVAAPRGGDSAESLFRRADQGLYRSKRLGRNQVQQAEETVQQAADAGPPDVAKCAAVPG
jgi:diguanylate cyclase